ncbi:hypothetical protein KIW84_050584 [Lathyrus oleraceus]|uniref:Uncharacterized protein n=1 Tax=Pisum sativum TaxID=3888 RepID=A0A9D4WK37_PEA|nr:hypothetical protein KIW84_050584 [Pisum sativum]
MLSSIERKRSTAMCHGQSYQQRVMKAFDKKIKPRVFRGTLCSRKSCLSCPIPGASELQAMNVHMLSKEPLQAVFDTHNHGWRSSLGFSIRRRLKPRIHRKFGMVEERTSYGLSSVKLPDAVLFEVVHLRVPGSTDSSSKSLLALLWGIPSRVLFEPYRGASPASLLFRTLLWGSSPSRAFTKDFNFRLSSRPVFLSTSMFVFL